MNIVRPRPVNSTVGPVLIWLNLDSKEEMNELYALCSGSQAKMVSQPESKPWGLHEFTVEDLDGNAGH